MNAVCARALSRACCASRAADASGGFLKVTCRAVASVAIVRDERVDDLAKLLKGLAQHEAASEQEK